jgi:hypothetical protein
MRGRQKSRNSNSEEAENPANEGEKLEDFTALSGKISNALFHRSISFHFIFALVALLILY